MHKRLNVIQKAEIITLSDITFQKYLTLLLFSSDQKLMLP